MERKWCIKKKVYAKDSKRKRIQDIWEFKDVQQPIYPMQRNNAMLQRIIQMCSQEDSIVLGRFCGGGGFLKEAFLLGRKFIGIDASKEAIKINQYWMEEYNQQNLMKCEHGKCQPQDNLGF